MERFRCSCNWRSNAKAMEIVDANTRNKFIEGELGSDICPKVHTALIFIGVLESVHLLLLAAVIMMSTSATRVDRSNLQAVGIIARKIFRENDDTAML